MIIREGTITVVPPGEVHVGESVSARRWDYRAVYSNCDVVMALAEEVGLPRGTMPPFPALSMADAELAAAFARAHRRCETPTDAMELEGVVSEILMAELQRHVTPGAFVRHARRRRSFIA